MAKWVRVPGKGLARFHREQRGAVLVLVAAGIVMLCGFAALAVDGGQLFVTRGEMQNGADAAALAGGQSLHVTQTEAEQKAREWAANNDITNEEIVSVDFGVNCSGSSREDSIRVQVERPVEFGFARVLGINEWDVEACATAVLGSRGSGDGVVPLSVDKDLIVYDGGTTILKYDSSNKNGANTSPLALDGNGASRYRDALKHGSDSEICASESSDESCIYDTEPGNMTGPTRDAINYRLDNTSSACDTEEEVFEQRPDGKYAIKGGCNPFQGDDDSRRVLLIPVIPELPGNGRKEVEIIRFAIFWLEDLPSCTGNNCTIRGTFYDVVGDIGGKLGKKTEGILFARLVD